MSAKKKQKLDNGGEENNSPSKSGTSFSPPAHPDFTEWSWDVTHNPKILVKNNGNRVMFNPSFSVGTQAIRGTSPLKHGYHHYYEVLMSTDVYGTDMMVGIGTGNVDLEKYTHTFVSFLGLDNESYGLSYSGSIHHNGEFKPYAQTFGKGDRIGVHVNLWSGTLEYYLNSKPLGVAFTNLNPKINYYPMICSTSARSGMTLTYSNSYKHNLQFNAICKLAKQSLLVPGTIPPGLAVSIKNNFWWLQTPKNIKPPNPTTAKNFRRKKLVMPLDFDDSSDEENAETAKPNENLESADDRRPSISADSPASKRLRLRSLN